MSTKSKMTMDSFSVEIPNDFITIKIILSNGQNLIDYQKQTGKQLLLIGMEHKRRDQTNNFIFDYYKMEACSQTGLEGYFCVNFNKQLGVQSNFSKTSVKLNYNNTQDQQDKLTLIWSQCDKRYNEVGEICEDDANVVKNQIISLNTQITVRIKLNQFNPFTKQIESKWKSETYLIDSVLSLISQIKLKLDNATVIDGLVIQQTQKMSYVSDYSRVDTTLTQDFISKYFDLKVFGCIILYLNEYNTDTNVQYIAFSYIIAQFTSIFHIIILFGLFCKKISESDIICELIQQQLKIKYKQTALNLINKIQQIDSQKCLESYKILYDINFKDKFKRIFEVGIIRRLQLFFISSSQQDLLKSKNITQEQSILLRMIDQSQQYTNIFYIQRQILEVQNMLKLLFSEQQYAAVKLCGIKLSLNYSQTTNNQIDNNQISQNQIKNSIINKKNMENLINQNRIDCELVKQNFITENQNDKDKAQNYLATENLSQNFQQIVKEDINIELQNKDQQLIKSLGNIENNQIISENKDNKKTQLSINSQKYQENSSSSLQNMQKQDNKVAKPAAISQVQFNELNKEYLRNNEQNQNQIDFNMIEIESQESIKMNHLEKLELIDQDYSYFQQQVKNFINQYKLDNQNTSEIDKRIYNSILGVPELQII
ncbi:hypothetical protein ABPG74_009433 [Tetrahymena malaccensis]